MPYNNDDFSAIYWYKYLYYPTYNRLDGLLVGVSIAGIYQFLPKIWQKIAQFGNISFILSLAVLVAAYFLCANQQSYYASIFGFPLVAFDYGFMVVGAISPTSFLYKWQSKTTTFLATISYAVYLTHKGIIHIVQKVCDNFNEDMDSHLVLLISIVACILSAILLHLVIEKPFMMLRNRMMATQISLPPSV